MVFAGMNYLAILVAAVAAFGFGSLYYMSLSSQWLAAIGKKKEELSPSMAPFVISIVSLLVMAQVLAGTIAHLGGGQVTVRTGIITGAFMWLGFVATTTATNYAFGGRKASLTVIDCIHWLGVLVIQGAVIGAIGI
ncbi:MAG: DUF1761 domain-containing protein [Reyranella sp.]|jgi:hypothetical protein|nr:MAG: DUF1761 domain-containing protein [Reyranella sp.]